MELENFTYKFLKENYDYLYLKSQLLNANNKVNLITGSSHGLLGIDMYEMGYDQTANLSMHSQDIYYSMLSIKHFIECAHKTNLNCVLIAGYYIPYQDLSRAGSNAFSIIKKVFFPLYSDSHNTSVSVNNPCDCLWSEMPEESYKFKNEIYKFAIEMLSSRKQYINDLYSRRPYFSFEKNWRNLSEEEKNEFGRKRAQQHNKHLKYKESYNENQIYIQEIKRMITEAGGRLFIIIPPFSKSYYTFLEEEMIVKARDFYEKNASFFIDINNDETRRFFCDDDFVDTDHLNGRGAYKLSKCVLEIIK